VLGHEFAHREPVPRILRLGQLRNAGRRRRRRLLAPRRGVAPGIGGGATPYGTSKIGIYIYIYIYINFFFLNFFAEFKKINFDFFQFFFYPNCF